MYTLRVIGACKKLSDESLVLLTAACAFTAWCKGLTYLQDTAVQRENTPYQQYCHFGRRMVTHPGRQTLPCRSLFLHPKATYLQVLSKYTSCRPTSRLKGTRSHTDSITRSAFCKELVDIRLHPYTQPSLLNI